MMESSTTPIEHLK